MKERLADSGNYGGFRTAGQIRYLVIHYTGNKGDTAVGNAAYFATGSRGASAHYFVDESEVWRSVPELRMAWHCGTKGVYCHPECRNANSIGIEICMWDKTGGLRQGSIDRAAALARELMERYGISASRVVRHYDVTGKRCPAPFVDDPALWEAFRERLEGEAVRYQYLKDVPAAFQGTIKMLMDAGIIQGDGSDPTGNGAVIDLTRDQVRTLMFCYRGGAFDARLRAAGLKPAVE